MIGGRLPAAGRHLSRVPQKAVLQLLLAGRVHATQHPVGGWDLHPCFAAEILRQQRFQEDQPAGAVGQRMEKLHGDAVAVHQHPEGAPADIVKGHMHQRIAFFRLNRRRCRDLLQVVPEGPPAQPHRDGGEPAHRDVQRRLQQRDIYRLGKGGGKPEQIVPVAAAGRRVDLGGVIQPHPAQLALPSHHPAEELVHLLKVRHIFIKIVQHIGVPALRRDDHAAAAAALLQLLVQAAGIVQQELIPAGKQQGGRQPGQVPVEGGDHRLLFGMAAGGVAAGVEPQQLRGQGGIVLPVGDKALSGAGKIGPWGNGDQPAGHCHSQLPQAQAQGVDQPAARAFAAQDDLPGQIALSQQIAVAFQSVLQRRGKGVFRCQAVGRAEHLHAAFVGQRRAEALGVLQAAAGVAAAVQVQDDPLAALIAGDDPGALEPRKPVVPHNDVLLMDGLHQLAQLILRLAGRFQRAARHKRLEKMELRANQLCRQSHTASPPFGQALL